MFSEPRDVPVAEIAALGRTGGLSHVGLTQPDEVRWNHVTGGTDCPHEVG